MIKKVSKKKIKIDYETRYIYGVKVICKNWVPKDMVIRVASRDEHGFQEVVIERLSDE